MVFYFTGTGNSLYAARELAGAGEEVRSIAQELRRTDALCHEDDAIGIVYPIYGHMMPAMVRTFIQRARLETPYLYVVCTYGNRHANAVELCETELRCTGLEPSYIATLLMVDNWLPGFDMDEQRAQKPSGRIDEEIARIRADIAARRCWIEPVTDDDRAAHEEFLSRGISVEPADVQDMLAIDCERCVGCGVCARVCPASCTEVRDGRAFRDAEAGFGCNACLACAHACPERAITLPGGEKNPSVRFRNEHVTLQDIIMANGAR